MSNCVACIMRSRGHSSYGGSHTCSNTTHLTTGQKEQPTVSTICDNIAQNVQTVPTVQTVQPTIPKGEQSLPVVIQKLSMLPNPPQGRVWFTPPPIPPHIMQKHLASQSAVSTVQTVVPTVQTVVPTVQTVVPTVQTVQPTVQTAQPTVEPEVTNAELKAIALKMGDEFKAANEVLTAEVLRLSGQVNMLVAMLSRQLSATQYGGVSNPPVQPGMTYSPQGKFDKPNPYVHSTPCSNTPLCHSQPGTLTKLTKDGSRFYCHLCSSAHRANKQK